MAAGIMFFFLDMEQRPGSGVRELYGFAHLGFFMFMAMGLSRLPALGRRRFMVQFLLIMTVVFLVGAIIEVIQPYFSRTAKWRDLGIDLAVKALGADPHEKNQNPGYRRKPVKGNFQIIPVGAPKINQACRNDDRLCTVGNALVGG